MGGTVGWDGKARKVTISLDGTEIAMVIDKTAITVNGKKKEIDVAPKIINGRTMLPLRFVVENLGFEADWDGDSQTVTITR